MDVYLDCCCLQRPFDDQTQLRIRVESEAVLAILAAAEAGAVSLLSSEVLEHEIDLTPDQARRGEAKSILKLTTRRLEITDDVVSLASDLEKRRIRPFDALHLALASTANADYFVTCDDRLLRKCRGKQLNCRPVSILELVKELA